MSESAREIGGESSGTKAESSREELNQLVSALKDAIMDLRETVSELSNPLTKLEPSVPSGRGPQEVGISTSEGLSGKEEVEMRQSPQKEEVSSFTLPLVPAVGEGGKAMSKDEGPTRLNLRKVLSLLKLLLELRQSVEPSLMQKYIDVFRKLNLVTSEETELLKDLVNLAMEGSKYGLTAEDHVAVMALLAKTLGIEDRDLEEESLKLLLKSVKKRISVLGDSEESNVRES